MNITIVRERFLEILQKGAYFTSNKITDLKIFKAVLINAKQNAINIYTSNANEYFSGEIGGKVFKTGTVLLDLKTLIETVKNLRDSKISLEKKNNQLVISSASGEVKLICLDDNNFPTLEKSEKNINLKKELFISGAVESVLFSCATDEARPILTGVCYDFQEKETRLVGTDGFRLSLLKTSIVSPEMNGNKVIISGKSLMAIFKVFKDADFKVYLASDFSRIFFESGETLVSSKVLDGEYPPYEKVVPAGYETSVVLKTKEFLEVVRASSLFAKEGSGMLNLAINNKEVVVSSAGVGVGEATFKLAPLEFSGKENRIVFNYRYLLDYLSLFKEEEFVFEMSTAFAPGMFRAKKDTNLIHIIMPIRSQE